LIGVLHWIVELVRVDICVEISMMSSHLTLPRAGHLDKLFLIFAYLKKYADSKMVFDPSLPKVDMNDFAEEDWNYSIYSEEQKDLHQSQEGRGVFAQPMLTVTMMVIR